MKLLVLGNAHTACLSAAWRRVPPSGFNITVFAAPGDRLAGLEAAGGVLWSSNPAVSASLRSTGGDEQVTLGDYDYVVICGLSPPPGDYIPYSSTASVSNKGRAQNLDNCPLEESAARRLLRTIRLGSDIPVGFAGKPAPVDERYDFVDDGALSSTIASRHAALGVDWIAQPPETRLGPGSTHPKFIHRSPRLSTEAFFSDRIHMNVPFGEAWGRRIITAACAATGRKAPAWCENCAFATESEADAPWMTEAPRFSQGVEELLIREYFEDQRGGYFVDVGAGPPLKGSNTAFLELHLGWKGIGIDALGHYEEAYMKQRPRTRFMHRVVAEASSPARPFFHVVAAAGLSSTDGGREFRGERLRSKRIDVPAATLDELLAMARLPRIDFMSIDVEASNLDCLAGIDLARHRPRLICMETGNPMSHERRDIIDHFESAGFEVVPQFRRYEAPNTWFRPRATP